MLASDPLCAPDVSESASPTVEISSARSSLAASAQSTLMSASWANASVEANE